MYALRIDSKALATLEHLPRPLSHRIFKKLQNTKENPHFYFERLVQQSTYKLRIGNYRVIADLDDTHKIIHVLHIDHRRRVYKK